MPRTRWSRASTSTLVSAARHGRGIRLGTGARLPSRRGGGLGGRTLGALGLDCLGLPGLSLARVGLPGLGLPGLSLARVGLPGLGLPGLGLPGLGLPGLGLPGLGLPGLSLPGLGLPGLGLPGLSLPGLGLARVSLAGLGLAVASLAVASLAVASLAVPGLHVPGLRAAGPALALRRGAALRQRLGQRGGENLLLVTARRSGLERSLGSGQALEALPVAGHLEQLAYRVGRLRADRQPVLRPVRIDLDQRGIRFRVVLPDLLDGTAISLGAGIGDNDPVVGLADLAHAL